MVINTPLSAGSRLWGLCFAGFTALKEEHEGNYCNAQDCKHKEFTNAVVGLLRVGRFRVSRLSFRSVGVFLSCRIFGRGGSWTLSFGFRSSMIHSPTQLTPEFMEEQRDQITRPRLSHNYPVTLGPASVRPGLFCSRHRFYPTSQIAIDGAYHGCRQICQ